MTQTLRSRVSLSTPLATIPAFRKNLQGISNRVENVSSSTPLPVTFNLSTEEEAALLLYSGADYRTLNHHLQKGNELSTEEYLMKEVLPQALEKMKRKEGDVVKTYRGGTLNFLKGVAV